MQSISIQKAAELLHSSRSHVYLLIQQKRLQIIRIGNKDVLSFKSVQRYKSLKDKYEAIQKEMRKEYYKDAG